MNTSPSNKNHYPALDGIRGIAILLVVFFHNFGFLNYFVFGWLGVDLFFVLSGFLISNILLKTVGQKGYLTKFYIRRMLRIFPLYYSVLMVTIFILPHIDFLNDNLQYYVNNQWWFWLYIQNWLFVVKPLEGTNFLAHFWSLAVEEQFYLVWPFVILLIRKPKPLLFLLAFILVAVIVTRIFLWEHHVEKLQYFGLYTFTRIDGICIGCMLALLMNINAAFLRKYTGLIVLLLSAANFIFFFLNREHSFSFPFFAFFAFIGYTTFAVMFALLVYEAVVGETVIIQKIFSLPVLVFLGKISFGFYVFHWPVYVALNSRILFFLQTQFHLSFSGSQFLSSVVCTVIGFAVSVASFYFFEARFLNLKKRFN